MEERLKTLFSNYKTITPDQINELIAIIVKMEKDSLGIKNKINIEFTSQTLGNGDANQRIFYNPESKQLEFNLQICTGGNRIANRYQSFLYERQQENRYPYDRAMGMSELFLLISNIIHEVRHCYQHMSFRSKRIDDKMALLYAKEICAMSQEVYEENYEETFTEQDAHNYQYATALKYIDKYTNIKEEYPEYYERQFVSCVEKQKRKEKSVENTFCNYNGKQVKMVDALNGMMEELRISNPLPKNFISASILSMEFNPDGTKKGYDQLIREKNELLADSVESEKVDELYDFIINCDSNLIEQQKNISKTNAKIDFVFGNDGKVYRTDNVPCLHNMSVEERINYAKSIISNYSVNSAEYKYYNDIINQNNYQKNSDKSKDDENEISKCSKIQEEIDKVQQSLGLLTSQKIEVDEELDKLYKQETDLLRSGLPANDRYYKKIKIQIMQKKLELKSISLDDSIVSKKNYIFQKQISLERINNKINAETYSYQMDIGRMKASISGLESDLSYNYLEIELLELKNCLASLQTSRGEISSESRENQIKENNKKIEINKECIETLVQEIFNERKKTIAKEIAFRRKINYINKATWEAQLNALNSATTLNESSASEIANIYVEENGPKR